MTSPTRMHKTSLHLGHGSENIMMSAKFEFIISTAVDESPDLYKEKMMLVIDELHQTLKGIASAPDFCKTKAETIGP